MKAETSTITVRLTPRAKREAILGVVDGVLRIGVNAPPVDGAANEALVAFLCELFDVPKRSVRIIGGHTTRNKRVELDVSPRRVSEVLTLHSTGHASKS